MVPYGLEKSLKIYEWKRYGYSRRYDNAMVKYKTNKCSNKLPVLFSFILNLKLFHVLLIILNYYFFFPWLKFKSLYSKCFL